MTQAAKRHETPKEWAARVIAEHGPPPQHAIDLVNRMRRKAAENTARAARPDDAA